jgi:DNA-binding LacI/PurR family transcriptional regulator
MAGIRRATTIKQVAEEAGVSMMTVSAVLRPQGKQNYPIAAATREKVLAAAQKLNYVPSAVAQSMRGQRINAIGVVLINPNARFQDDPYISGVVDGIISVANTAGQNTSLFTGQRWSNASESLSLFCDGRTDGLIILSPSSDLDIVAALLDVGMPFVLVNGHSDDPRVSSVDIDNCGAMKTLVGRVAALGHRRIAYLAGRETSRSAQQRGEGYRRALTSAGVPSDPELMPVGGYSVQSGYERTRKLLTLSSENRPTTLCCGSDQIAIGALRALRESDIAVPGEMSLTGFDDIREAATLLPPLTTVHHPFERLGSRAAEILLANISGGKPLGSKEFISTEIIWRQSVTEPPKY